MRATSNNIEDAVRERFGAIARSPAAEQRFPVGRESARRLGYDPREIDTLPASVIESFCGVGNPLSLGEVHPGDTVLDLGSGAGLDSFLAARRVGATGAVVGVDMTAEMVAKARGSAAELGLTNVRFLLSRVENLPLENASVDVAIVNGFYNLCVDKPKALAQTYRVLKPGGRLLMADILLEEHVTPAEVGRLGTWSD